MVVIISYNCILEMKVLKLSELEYKNLYKYRLPCRAVQKNNLRVTRSRTDDKQCRVEMRGYPIMPPSWYATQTPEDKLESLADIIAETKPEQIAVQIDPMPFLYKAREFGIETLPTIQEQYRKTEMGVFGRELDEKGQNVSADITEEERQAERKIEEQRYNYMFPVQWQESKVSPAVIMLLSGHFQSIKDAEYFGKALLHPEQASVSNQEHQKLI